MDTTETYIKMCDCPEMQEQRINDKYPEFPLKAHYEGDVFFYTNKFTCVINMTGDDTPPVYETGIHICGTGRVQGANIPKREQYLTFPGGYKVFEEPLTQLVWLPRQDQLQEMVCEDWGLQTICTRLEEFSKAAEGGVGTTISGSMEQLWLAFVLKEKFNKTWDGDKWV